MKTGVEFLQRMREDAEFRQQVNACPNGPARLAFLQREGYDFTVFVQILDNLSSVQRSAGGSKGSGQSAGPGQGVSGFFSRLRQIFRAPPLSGPHR
jgi:predicted ribosomally synthesized peptide with nif11-like leader